MAVRVELNPAALAAELRGPGGIVFRDIVRRAQQVQVKARMLAPVKTGCLRDSIRKQPLMTPQGPGVQIVADTTPCGVDSRGQRLGYSYAMMVHEGTKPHVIRATGGRALRFFWQNGPDGPGWYFFTEVNHPGTRPQPFLRDALDAAFI